MSLSLSKVTDNTHEMSFHELMSQSAQLRVPLFQRPYVWGDKQLQRMIQEIDSIIDGEDSNRFLGAIIAVRRLANPAEPQPFEIVDGQQRLTTLYLFILAASLVSAKHGDIEYAKALVNANLIVPWSTATPNTKLVPSFGDRAQFKEVFSRLYEVKGLLEWLPESARLPDAKGENKGKLDAQFTRIRRFLDRRFKEDGAETLKSIIEAARTRLTFVFILLKDPATATTVFEGLNDPGVPIGVGDLVKNEVFAKVGDAPDKAIAIHSTYWLPFESKLGASFDDYFFPYCIVHEPGALRADMFKELRKLWGESADAASIISQLDEYTEPFLAISGGVIPPGYSPKIAAAVDRLVRMRRPAAVFPFVMRLLKAYSDGVLEESHAVDVLGLIEAFLVRRALCGLEPTGLLGLFRFLWNNVNGAPTYKNVSEVIFKRLTVEWPDDERLGAQIISRPLYGSSMANYVILEYERSRDGDFPEGVPLWIEHVLPQKMTEGWKTLFSPEAHKGLVDTWANLVPLSSEMNRELSQGAYDLKREAFRKGSAFVSAREFGEAYDSWSPDKLSERAKELVTWAKARWPRPIPATS